MAGLDQPLKHRLQLHVDHRDLGQLEPEGGVTHLTVQGVHRGGGGRRGGGAGTHIATDSGWPGSSSYMHLGRRRNGVSSVPTNGRWMFVHQLTHNRRSFPALVDSRSRPGPSLDRTLRGKGGRASMDPPKGGQRCGHTMHPDHPAMVVGALVYRLILAMVVDDERLVAATATMLHG